MLAETDGPAGYAASAWTCTGGTLTGASVVVPNGGNVTCTINNNDVPGTWTISKESNPASGTAVKPGDVITYTVTAAKLTGTDPQDVVVVDDLAAVLDHATYVDGSATATTGTVEVVGTSLTWSIPVLSGVQTVTYQVKVNADADGVRLVNHITSEGSEPCVEPPAPDNERAAAEPARPSAKAAADDCTTTTHDTPAWNVVKTSDPASGSQVPVGSTIAYTLKAPSTYNPPVTDAVVTDDLSKVLNHATLVAVPAGATLSGTTLTWKVPTLAAKGDAASLTYQVKLDSDAYAVTVTNVATPGPGGGCANSCTTNHKTPPKVTPPPVNPPPVNPPPVNPPTNPELPITGSSVAPFLGLGGLLVVLGSVALWFGRRPRRASGEG